MSYHIYTTRGIVLAYRPRREADRIYSIFTRDFGLVRATGLAVRKEGSKLRGALEPIAISNVSLVRGKESWRITSAELIQRPSISQSLYRPLDLLVRLVQGEQASSALYDVVEEALLTPETPMSEILLAAKILYELGYLTESDLSLNKSDLTKAINEGIKASNLT